MKTYTVSKTAQIVILYLALVYALAVLFTSCASTHPYQGCYVGKPLSKVDSTRVQHQKKIALGTGAARV